MREDNSLRASRSVADLGLQECVPCPFCGGRDISFAVRKPSYGQCQTCLTEGPSADRPTEAIAVWNRRAAPALARAASEMRTVLTETLAAMETADHLLDRDTEEQIRKVFDYDPPADAEILISGKTYLEILAVFERVEKFRKLIAATGGLKFELSKEWCRDSAQIEGDAEIGAGPSAKALGIKPMEGGTSKSDAQRAFEEAMAPRQNPPHPMFRDHNCAYCDSGKKPCRYSNPSQCGYPYARND